MPCVYHNDGSCSYQKHRETRSVYYKHICSTCISHEGKSSAHGAVECRQKSRESLGMAFGVKGPAQEFLLLLSVLPKLVKNVIPSKQGKSPCSHKTVYTGQTVDPVPCHNRFDPLKQFDTQDIGEKQCQPSPDVTKINKITSKVKSSKNSRNKSHETR